MSEQETTGDPPGDVTRAHGDVTRAPAPRTGLSSGVIVAGEAGLATIVLIGVVLAVKSLAGAFVRTFWRPIKD